MDIKAFLQRYIDDYSLVEGFFKQLLEKVNFQDIHISYNIDKSFTFTGKLNGKEILIRISGTNVTSLMVEGRQEVNTPININNIAKITLLLFTK